MRGPGRCGLAPRLWRSSPPSPGTGRPSRLCSPAGRPTYRLSGRSGPALPLTLRPASSQLRHWCGQPEKGVRAPEGLYRTRVPTNGLASPAPGKGRTQARRPASPRRSNSSARTWVGGGCASSVPCALRGTRKQLCSWKVAAQDTIGGPAHFAFCQSCACPSTLPQTDGCHGWPSIPGGTRRSAGNSTVCSGGSKPRRIPMPPSSRLCCSLCLQFPSPFLSWQSHSLSTRLERLPKTLGQSKPLLPQV